MYCQNCGTKLQEGAVFCPNCGKKLINDGSNHESSEFFLDFIKNLKVFFKKPADFYEDVKESNKFNFALIIFISVSVLSGLIGIMFKHLFISRIVQRMAKMPETLMEHGALNESEYTELNGAMFSHDYLDSVKESINYLYGNGHAFLSVTLITALVMAAVLVIICIINTAAKKNAEFKDIFFVTASSNIPFVIMFLIGAFFCGLNTFLGLFTIFCGMVFSCIRLHEGCRSIFKNENKFAHYCTVITIGAAAFILFIAFLVISGKIYSNVFAGARELFIPFK